MENYLQDMFIDEAKHALDRHSGSGDGGSAPDTIILVDESGNEYAAVLTEEEVDLTATPNDIREGCTAVTDNGVEVGEKYIPSYVVSEGYKVVTVGSKFELSHLADDDLYKFTKLQAVICGFNSNLSNSVSAEKVSILGNTYEVQSTDVIAPVVSDEATKTIDFGITNDADRLKILRYFMYKEIY